MKTKIVFIIYLVLIMLRLSKLTDYAIVIACYCARQPKAMHTAAEISGTVGIALPTVKKILKTMTQQHLFESIRGAHGGYRIAADPKDITVAQIIAALEGPIGLTECTQADNQCQQADGCDIRGNWALINQAIKQALESITLADMVKPAVRELPIAFSQLKHAAR